jgi:hypothetical protein
MLAIRGTADAAVSEPHYDGDYGLDMGSFLPFFHQVPRGKWNDAYPDLVCSLEEGLDMDWRCI